VYALSASELRDFLVDADAHASRQVGDANDAYESELRERVEQMIAGGANGAEVAYHERGRITQLRPVVMWVARTRIYAGDNERHAQLVELAARAEDMATSIDVTGVNNFQAQRRLIRVALEGASIAKEAKVFSPRLTGEVKRPRFRGLSR
jgi:hypothetical protein